MINKKLKTEAADYYKPLDAVTELHRIASDIDKNIRCCSISSEIRKCADELSALIKLDKRGSMPESTLLSGTTPAVWSQLTHKFFERFIIDSTFVTHRQTIWLNFSVTTIFLFLEHLAHWVGNSSQHPSLSCLQTYLFASFFYYFGNFAQHSISFSATKQFVWYCSD